MHKRLYPYYDADGGGAAPVAADPPGAPVDPPAGATPPQGVSTPPAKPAWEDVRKDETYAVGIAGYTEEVLRAAKAKWDEDAAEAARLAKLTDAERKTEADKAERAKFEADKAALAHERALHETTKLLAADKLPLELAAMLTGADTAQTTANIKAVKTAIDAAIQAGVEERLRGRAPAAGSAPAAEDGVTAAFKAKNPGLII
ncbi:MAG: DUF4355 domain-containing protein [Clostridiales bacterium]|nr:DUF4355 domain-containing protein [Clostridiales bacterium]